MKFNLSALIFIIGALSSVVMVYLLIIEEPSKLFYIMMLISLSSGQLIQYIKWKKKKRGDSASQT
jgi:hypothetical protein